MMSSLRQQGSCVPNVLLQVSDKEYGKELGKKIRSLGGIWIDSEKFTRKASHLVCDAVSLSEKFIGACVRGLWVLSPKFIEDSSEAGIWLSEEEYEFSAESENQPYELISAARQWRWRKTVFHEFPFSGWRVAVMPHPKTQLYERLLAHGGAKLFKLSLPVKSRQCLEDVTYVFMNRSYISEVSKLQAYGVVCLQYKYILDFIIKGETLDPQQYLVSMADIGKEAPQTGLGEKVRKDDNKEIIDLTDDDDPVEPKDFTRKTDSDTLGSCENFTSGDAELGKSETVQRKNSFHKRHLGEKVREDDNLEVIDLTDDDPMESIISTTVVKSELKTGKDFTEKTDNDEKESHENFTTNDTRLNKSETIHRKNSFPQKGMSVPSTEYLKHAQKIRTLRAVQDIDPNVPANSQQNFIQNKSVARKHKLVSTDSHRNRAKQSKKTVNNERHLSGFKDKLVTPSDQPNISVMNDKKESDKTASNGQPVSRATAESSATDITATLFCQHLDDQDSQEKDSKTSYNSRHIPATTPGCRETSSATLSPSATLHLAPSWHLYGHLQTEEDSHSLQAQPNPCHSSQTLISGDVSKNTEENEKAVSESRRQLFGSINGLCLQGDEGLSTTVTQDHTTVSHDKPSSQSTELKSTPSPAAKHKVQANLKAFGFSRVPGKGRSQISQLRKSSTPRKIELGTKCKIRRGLAKKLLMSATESEITSDLHNVVNSQNVHVVSRTSPDLPSHLQTSNDQQVCPQNAQKMSSERDTISVKSLSPHCKVNLHKLLQRTLQKLSIGKKLGSSLNRQASHSQDNNKTAGVSENTDAAALLGKTSSTKETPSDMRELVSTSHKTDPVSGSGNKDEAVLPGKTSFIKEAPKDVREFVSTSQHQGDSMSGSVQSTPPNQSSESLSYVNPSVSYLSGWPLSCFLHMRVSNYKDKPSLSALHGELMEAARDMDFYTSALSHGQASAERAPTALMLSELLQLALSTHSHTSCQAYGFLKSWLEHHPPITPIMIKVYTEAFHIQSNDSYLLNTFDNLIKSPATENTAPVFEYLVSLFETNFNSCLLNKDRNSLIRKWLWCNSLALGINGNVKRLLQCFQDAISISRPNLQLISAISALLGMVVECVRLSSVRWQQHSLVFTADAVLSVSHSLAKSLKLLLQEKKLELVMTILSDLRPDWLRVLVVSIILSKYNDFLLKEAIDVKQMSLYNIVAQYFFLLPVLTSDPRVQTQPDKTEPIANNGDNNQIGKSQAPSAGTSATDTSVYHKSSPKKHTAAKINKRNAKGESALHIACKKKNNAAKVAELLSVPGVDVNLADNNGWTPLHEACNHGNYQSVELLLKYIPPLTSCPDVQQAVDLNAKAEDGITPLQDAVQMGHIEICKLLLKYGGQHLLKARTAFGYTALDLAESDEMAALLSACDLNSQDSSVSESSDAGSQDLCSSNSVQRAPLSIRYKELANNNRIVSQSEFSVFLSLLSVLVSSYYSLLRCVQQSGHSASALDNRDPQVCSDIKLHVRRLRLHVKKLSTPEDFEALQFDLKQLEAICLSAEDSLGTSVPYSVV